METLLRNSTSTGFWFLGIYFIICGFTSGGDSDFKIANASSYSGVRVEHVLQNVVSNM